MILFAYHNLGQEIKEKKEHYVITVHLVLKEVGSYENKRMIFLKDIIHTKNGLIKSEQTALIPEILKSLLNLSWCSYIVFCLQNYLYVSTISNI